MTVLKQAPRSAFPNYTQMPQAVPQPLWYLARVLAVGISFGIMYILFVNPPLGLFIFWRLVVPCLPILFFVAPGLWRNICPMAALNQAPRLFGFTRNWTLPQRMQEYAYVIGIVIFFVVVPTRKALFNTNGPALAFLLIAVYATAFLGGFFFKGKSGWCSSICPLLPVQRLYGQTPFITIPNNHCRPCVGCAKNCFDFNPAVASLADQYDKDKHYSGYRRIFAAAFPGLVLAFYTIPNPPAIDLVSMYSQIALTMLLSLGSFFLVETFLRLTSVQVTTLYAAAALNLYYIFNVPTMADTVAQLLQVSLPHSVLLTGVSVVPMVAFLWTLRTARKEPQFVQWLKPAAPPAAILPLASAAPALASQPAPAATVPAVTFEPQHKLVSVSAGSSLLEIAEANELRIEAGCRMGVCGADPVAILSGMDCLSAIGDDEQSTLQRLGLATNTRMACCARVHGAVSVSLKPEMAGAPPKAAAAAPVDFDHSLKRVVIIGNGIAGITAADHIRRRHPDCAIYVIAREKHHLYNRMGLSRLIYGRSAMQGLYLMPESWYDEHNITTWLNTRALRIDRAKQVVELADGESLPYDRLVLAAGSEATVPPLPGFGVPGSFVLRSADDAMHMRHFVQQHLARTAVVAGGGLLGLEAAYALHKLGLQVAVLERSPWPMRRQLDERGGSFLCQYLAQLHIDVLTKTEIASLKGARRVEHAVLKDGRELPCDLFLICAGITPNVELAREAGLQVNQGVIVDDQMRTTDPSIFAAGDIAEHAGRIHGLWPVSVEQAEVAAVNITGGSRTYQGTVPSTLLKVAGVDLSSIGRFDAESTDDIVITLEEPDKNRYRKLVINGGRIAGAILLGYPLEAPVVTSAIKSKRDVSSLLAALRAGRWDVLGQVQ